MREFLWVKGKRLSSTAYIEDPSIQTQAGHYSPIQCPNLAQGPWELRLSIVASWCSLLHDHHESATSHHESATSQKLELVH
jgi:hypothetical protein